MTNREWYFNKLNKMTDEEFAEEWFFADAFTDYPWCVLNNGGKCKNQVNCKTCCANWLKAKRTEPMPELKPGMFVKVNNNFDTRLGIIIENPYDSGLAVNYKDDAGWDRMDDLTVKAIYKAVLYSDCDEDHVIWMNEE